MSNYPESIDAFSPVTGDTEMTEHAERHTAEESSIVAIENTLGVNPEGESDTVAERLNAQDTLIESLPTPNTYKLETDANVRSVPQIQLVDQDDEYSNVVFNAGEGIFITSVGSGLNFAVDTDIIPDVSGLATKDELSAGLADKADEPHTHDDLAADNHTHDTTHDHQEYFLSGVEFDVDGNPLPLPYGDAKTLGEAVEANTTAIAEIDTSTLPLSESVDVRAATLTTQKDANEYFASEFENKLDKAPTWGELAGRA